MGEFMSPSPEEMGIVVSNKSETLPIEHSDSSSLKANTMREDSSLIQGGEKEKVSPEKKSVSGLESFAQRAKRLAQEHELDLKDSSDAAEALELMLENGSQILHTVPIEYSTDINRNGIKRKRPSWEKSNPFRDNVITCMVDNAFTPKNEARDVFEVKITKNDLDNGVVTPIIPQPGRKEWSGTVDIHIDIPPERLRKLTPEEIANIQRQLEIRAN